MNTRLQTNGTAAKSSESAGSPAGVALNLEQIEVQYFKASPVSSQLSSFPHPDLSTVIAAVRQGIEFLDLYSYYSLNANALELLRQRKDARVVAIGTQFIILPNTWQDLYPHTFCLNYDAVSFLTLVPEGSVEYINVDFWGANLGLDREGADPRKEWRQLTTEAARILTSGGSISMYIPEWSQELVASYMRQFGFSRVKMFRNITDRNDFRRIRGYQIDEVGIHMRMKAEK